MSAPKTKPKSKSKEESRDESRGVQLIVFAPIKSDPEDEDNRIYMVCPSSMKVVEVIEKYDDEAEEYIKLLGKKKKKSEVKSSTFIEDLGKSVQVDDSVVENNSSATIEDDAEGEDDGITTISEELSDLDEDVEVFASKGLGDIFPDDGQKATDGASDVDLADALSLLDQEDNEKDLESLSDFVSDGDGVPEL